MELLCLTGVEDKLQVNSSTSHFIDGLPDILNSVAEGCLKLVFH